MPDGLVMTTTTNYYKIIEYNTRNTHMHTHLLLLLLLVVFLLMTVHYRLCSSRFLHCYCYFTFLAKLIALFIEHMYFPQLLLVTLVP